MGPVRHRRPQGGTSRLRLSGRVRAVDGATRQAVVENIAYVRRIGDIGVLPLLLAHLTGPCCLPPTDEPAPTPDPDPPGSEEQR